MNERQILALLKAGQVVFRYPLKAYFKEGEGGFGVSVPKRNFKRAVKRNLLKRRMRESYRLNCGRLEGRKVDMFVYYIGKTVEDYGRIEKSFVEILDDVASS